VQPIGVYQNEMHLITVRVELTTICTVDVNVDAELPWSCHWSGKLSIRFEPCHLLPTYCSFFFCYKLATNMLICCPVSDKMVLSVVSACLIAGYLYPKIFVKTVCILHVSSSLIHFHKSSPNSLHGIYFLVFLMPNKWK